MRRIKTDSRYLLVRGWVDRDILRNPRYSIALFGPIYAGTATFLGLSLFGSFGRIAFCVLFLPLIVAWVFFAAWRATRLLRADIIKSDRDYDRRGKYLLPPEYAATESPLAASRRRRRTRR